MTRAAVTDRTKIQSAALGSTPGDQSLQGHAANPFDLGVEHWLANLEQFKALSHIETLQTATTGKIQQNGGSVALANEMRASVIRDVLNNQLPVAIENDEKVAQEVGRLDELNTRLVKQLAVTGQQIEDARINLRNFAARYFSDLILQAKGSSLETFGDFFEREIGAEGIIVSTRLQNEFSRQTQSITLEVEKMQVGFDSEVNHFNTTVVVVCQRHLEQLNVNGRGGMGIGASPRG
nr:LeoA/HP0731 family dynamin-like GTPase [Pseudomonas taiwanensis]